MSIHHHLADLIEEAGGGSLLTLQPQCPELTTKQLTNALQQARRYGLIHAVGYQQILHPKATRIALYKAGPDPAANVMPVITRSRVTSVWDLGREATA